jgi:hypothetical protein
MDIPVGKAERKAFLEELSRRAQQGDAEAAFQLGAHNVTGGTEAHYDAADRCFLKAIEFGGSLWAWLAVDEYLYKDVTLRFGQWMARGIELDFPLPSAPGITVAPDTFEPTGDWSGITCADATFQICSDQAEEAVAALAAAVPRLIAVDQNGHEWTSPEAFNDLVGGPDAPIDRFGDPLSTPVYVSPPKSHPNGPYLTLDNDCQLWGPMARTMLLVLIEELVSGGVTEAHITSARSVRDDGPSRPD